MKYIIIIASILFLIVLLFISVYNKLAKAKIRVDEAFATMDVYLKQRWDLVPNIVETVKGYVKHEESLLTEIVRLRQSACSTTNADEKIELDNKLNKSIGSLFAIAESYPELKANAAFADLRSQLASCEKDIVNARKYYNGTVKQYNSLMIVFPNSIIAKLFGFKAINMYSINPDERENINIKF